MRFTSRRGYLLEKAQKEEAAAKAELDKATTPEEIEAALGKLRVAKSQKSQANEMPSTDFLCLFCNRVKEELARITIPVIGFSIKDAEGETVEMVSFYDGYHHITGCADCLAVYRPDEYLRNETIPEGS